VTIERHEFLSEKQCQKIREYFGKHLEDKCIGELLGSRFRQLKTLQQRHEDNLKEVREDERIERDFQAAAQEFERLQGLVQEYADVLDSKALAGKFVLIEDKTAMHKLVLKKKTVAADESNAECFPFDDEL
jgi:hypothetical protein